MTYPLGRDCMRMYIETYGCALNKADTALMKSLLSASGHEIVQTIEDADVVIINTCTVRKDSEERILKRLSVLKNLNGKKLIVAGCMAAAQPYTILKYVPNASLLSPQNVTEVVSLIESSAPKYLVGGERDVSYLEPYLEDRVATIPIAEGCLGDCAFCIVKIARRRLRSYRPGLIVRAVRKAIEQGALEIDLTAQDTGSYGIDLGNVRLPDLVRRVLDEVNGDYMIRIGMMNPDTILDVLDDLIEILRDRRVFKYVHLPLQSGSDKVLRIMKRKYSVDEYREIVKELRSKVEGITVATDIIVGHPGEDDEDFEMTIGVVKELMFDKVHIAQYTPRPRTEAAAMKQVPEGVKKARSTALALLVEEIGIRQNSEYIGSLARVLVATRSFRGDALGRTFNYRPVVIKEPRSFRGYGIVRIVGATFFDLRGELEKSWMKRKMITQSYKPPSLGLN